MNLFQSLLFLAELGSKIGNVETKFQVDIKELKRKNNLTFLRNLPEFDNTRNFVRINGSKAVVGTIIKRPLDNLIFSKIKIEYHYAIVLGTTIDEKEILIEMTKGKDVNIITKKDFLVEKFKETDIEIDFLPKKKITRENIIEKAREFQFDTYDLLDLNCKVFVEYIIFGIAIPKRRIEVKKFQSELCELRIKMYDLLLSDPSNDIYRSWFINRRNDAEKDKKNLEEKINTFS